MVNDDGIPPPHLPSPPSSVRKDSMVAVPLAGLKTQAEGPSSPTKPVPMPVLEETSSQSSKPSINAQKEKTPKAEDDDGAQDIAELRAQINKLNEKLREFKEPKQQVPFSSGRSNQLWSDQLGEHEQKDHQNVTAGALMAEFELNAYMEAQHDGRHLHRSAYVSYDANHEEYDPLDKLIEVEDVVAEDRQDEELPDDAPANQSQLNYVPWETFHHLGKNESTFAIDVLVGEPEPDVSAIFSRILQPTVPGQLSREVAPGHHANEDPPVPGMTKAPTISVFTPFNRAAHATKMPGRPAARGQAPLPDRIRINSPAIITALDKIMEMGNEHDRNEHDPKPTLMMQPFRALVYYKDEIRGWKAKLEAEVHEQRSTSTPGPKAEGESGEHKTTKETSDTRDQGRDAPKPDDSKPKSDEDPQPEKELETGEKRSDIDPILKTQKAVDDMACLVDFIDNELEERIAYLTSNDCQRVTFSDIWLLFKPGEAVLGQDGKQAYRVIESEYPTHCMKMPSPRECWRYGAKARLDDSPINIQCVYIDYDGEQIGPVVRSFAFHRFEGEKNIRSLDIIPIRLAKKPDDLEKTLIKRGATFIEACSAGRQGVPMHYSGFTMDTREEVDSQVVIDFEEAFTVHDGGSRHANRSSLTTIEQITLEVLAQEFKNKSLEKAKEMEYLVLRKSDAPAMMATRSWKPVIKDIDIQDNSVEDDNVTTYSDSDSDRPPARRSNKNTKCIPHCCANEAVYDDKYVENRRRNEFIQQQFRRHEAVSLAIAPRPLKEVLKDMLTGGGDVVGESEQLIVTYRVFGFIMRSRKWAQLDLTYLGPAKGENTFDLLVLPPGHRNMVEGLVTQHYLDKASATDETDQMDIVRGKGKGLIILLHGAPGVGKTTTAECVANYFQKPLFQITCGDLGSTADVVERRLEENFALASRWGCILLIDEADVFLEARQTENFDRNTLVAVFLRTLEYYTGILFLTTNRVGTFDEAFTSRIHISLYYPPLDQVSTLAVFKVNLDRIEARFLKKKERGVAELELDRRSVDEFILDYYARHEDARWNGRQIRNACQTALALAEFEAQKAVNPGVAGGRSVVDIVAAAAAAPRRMIHVKMTAKHFVNVAKAYLAFIKYLREVHGMTAAQKAKSFRLRNDRWEPHGHAGAGWGGGGPGSGLLASRQRGNHGSVRGEHRTGGGWWSQSKAPVRKQGMGITTRGMPGPSSGLGDEYQYGDDDFGEYGYGEEDGYGGAVDEGEALREGEEGAGEVDYESEGNGGAEDDCDEAAFSREEGDQAAEAYQSEYWDEELEADSPYSYEAQPKGSPQPFLGGRGTGSRGRGQQQMNFRSSATGSGRARGNGRGKVAAAASGGVSGQPAQTGRGDASRLGSRRGRGGAAAARGRSLRGHGGQRGSRN